MNIYAGLSVYDGIDKNDISSSFCNGYIVGDLFCSKKMFYYGEAGLYKTAGMIFSCGKEIIYQSRMYLTDRFFSDELSKISFLHDMFGLRKVLVQDVGFAVCIKEKYPEMIVIWSRLGRNRNSIINHSIPDFLKSIGVDAMECDDPEKIGRIQNYGFPVYAVYGSMHYNTLSRDCYNKYLLKKYDGICSRECITREMSLFYGNFSMTVNGNVLGEKIIYNDSNDFFETVNKSCDNLIVYAGEISLLREKCDNIKSKIQRREINE